MCVVGAREKLGQQLMFYETFIHNAFKCLDWAHNRNIYTMKREPS